MRFVRVSHRILLTYELWCWHQRAGGVLHCAQPDPESGDSPMAGVSVWADTRTRRACKSARRLPGPDKGADEGLRTPSVRDEVVEAECGRPRGAVVARVVETRRPSETG